jgi:SAM-dependent methyltransferase
MNDRSREPPGGEAQAIVERYARRSGAGRYSALRPEVWQTLQERQRAMLRLLATLGWGSFGDRRVLDVGCGDGGQLLEWLRLGIAPAHLIGIELLPERARAARERLPAAARVIEGDALAAPVEPASQDVVCQSVVFSSLLDDAFQQRLADTMWRWVKPGGGVLWYDFVYDNPSNRDVRGVPMRRVRELFPQAQVRWQRVTLAPPISRCVCRVHPAAYGVFNAVPWLRTHVLAWLSKNADTDPLS